MFSDVSLCANWGRAVCLWVICVACLRSNARSLSLTSTCCLQKEEVGTCFLSEKYREIPQTYICFFNYLRTSAHVSSPHGTTLQRVNMRKWEYSQFSRGHLFQQHPTPHTYPCTPLTFCGAPVYTKHLPGGDCFRNPVTEKWITVYIRLNLPFPKGKAFILEKNSSGELHRCLQVLWNASIFHAKLVSDLGTFSGVRGVGSVTEEVFIQGYKFFQIVTNCGSRSLWSDAHMTNYTAYNVFL